MRKQDKTTEKLQNFMLTDCCTTASCWSVKADRVDDANDVDLCMAFSSCSSIKADRMAMASLGTIDEEYSASGVREGMGTEFEIGFKLLDASVPSNGIVITVLDASSSSTGTVMTVVSSTGMVITVSPYSTRIVMMVVSSTGIVIMVLDTSSSSTGTVMTVLSSIGTVITVSSSSTGTIMTLLEGQGL